jgi:type II secretory pathway component GspD/PulD (secretin)
MRKVPLILILALLTAASAWPEAAAAVPALRVTSIGVKMFPGVVQVAITGSGPLRFRSATMDAPYRAIIDIPGATLAEGVPAALRVNQPPVLQVRAGQFQRTPPVVRVVIDLAAPTTYQVSAVTPNVLAARLAVPRVAMPAASKPRAVALPQPAIVAKAGTQVAQAQSQPPAASNGRITIDLRNAELADVLSALSKLCDFNIVTDASVKGAITVRLVDVTCEEALRFILEANNLGFRRVGRSLIILAAEKLAPPPEVPEPVIYPLGFANAEQVRTAIAASVPGVRVAIDVRTNILIVFGTAVQQEQVQKILASLDVQVAQIMIETRVVDITTDVLRDLGLSWGLTGYPITVTSVTVIGGFPATLTVGTTGGPVIATLAALVTQGKARVLSAPRVAVLDGNKATVNLGEEVPIPQVDTTGRITFTFKPIGVVLEITPRLNRDGLITTTISPEVSSVIQFLQTPAGPVPRIASRKASTIVQVRSGESIIIAGMISVEERETVVKVPLLGDIPIIGSLFRRTTTDRRESEVIFVVTPLIVTPPARP